MNTEIELLIKEYFPDLKTGYFIDADEQWEEYSRFVDLLCMIILKKKESNPPELVDRIGSLLNDMELMAALLPHEKSELSENEKKLLREIFINLRERGRINEENVPLPLWVFMNSGQLFANESMAFLLALCVDKNRKYERVFGVLQEQGSAIIKPTVGFVYDVCSLFMNEEENSLARLLDPDSFFNKLVVEDVIIPDGVSRLSRPLSLKRRVLSMALGESYDYGILSQVAELNIAIDDVEEDDEFILHNDKLDELLNIYSSVVAFERSGIICVSGPEKVGKTKLIKMMAQIVQRDLIIIDVKRLLSMKTDSLKDVLEDLACKAVFDMNIVLLNNFPTDEETKKLFAPVIVYLQSLLRIIFIEGEGISENSYPFTGDFHTVRLNSVSYEDQMKLWTAFANELDIAYAEDIDIGELVSKYNMTPGKIHTVLEKAVLQSEPFEEFGIIRNEVLEKCIRAENETDFGEFGTKIKTPFTMDDLLLHGNAMELVKRAISRIKHRSIVNIDYGFEKKVPYGNGTSILLYGPPGTGKTMAAQVIAKELGLDLYRIDLSQINSKYVGETEKHLKRLFDIAKEANVILFFDEADALFSKRTEVGNSNDKYANAETSFLLQKIEEYSGVTIMTTNAFGNFDAAMKRRITFTIPVLAPDEAERLILWNKVFPPEAELSDDVNLELLAKAAEITGSDIKQAALSAAYAAAAERRAITHLDIARAIDAQYIKSGHVSIINTLLF